MCDMIAWGLRRVHWREEDRVKKSLACQQEIEEDRKMRIAEDAERRVAARVDSSVAGHDQRSVEAAAESKERFFMMLEEQPHLAPPARA